MAKLMRKNIAEEIKSYNQKMGIDTSTSNTAERIINGSFQEDLENQRRKKEEREREELLLKQQEQNESKQKKESNPILSQNVKLPSKENEENKIKNTNANSEKIKQKMYQNISNGKDINDGITSEELSAAFNNENELQKAVAEIAQNDKKTKTEAVPQEVVAEAKKNLKANSFFDGIKKAAHYAGNLDQYQSDLFHSGKNVPTWADNLLTKASSIQATEKTYVNNVATAVTNAVGGIAKDEQYIASKEDGLGKSLMTAPATFVAEKKPEWVESLIDSTNEFAEQKDEENKKNSVIANQDRSAFGKSVGYINDNLAPTLGEMTPAIVTNVATGGTSAIPSAAVQYAVSNGSYYRDAEARGMNNEEAFWYSKIMAGVEAGTEYITASNINKTGNLFKSISKGEFGKSVKEVGLKKALSQLGTDTVEKGFFKSLATDALENAGQEAITEPINELVAGAVADKADWSNMGDRMISSAINGGIVAVIMGGANVGIPSAQNVNTKMQNNINNGQDVMNGISDTEIQKAYNDTSKVIDTDKIMTDSIKQQGTKLQSIIKQVNAENIQQQNNLTDNATANEQISSSQSQVANQNIQITSDDNLVSSAKKYNLNYEDLSIENSQKALDKRGIKARFDSKYFNSIDEGGKYILTTDDNGNVTSREIVLNPNADEKTIIQEMTIHELTHDIIASKTDASIKMYNEVLDYLKADKEYKNQITNLEESYLSIKDENGNPVYDRSNPNFNKMIEEEAIAKALQTKFGNQEEIDNLVKYKPSIARNLYNWIVDKLNRLTGGKIEKLYWHDIKNKFEKAFSQEGNYKDTDIRHSKEVTKDNIKYIKLDGNLFKNEDGTLKTPREAYNSLIGKTLILDDGSNVKIVNKLENIIEPKEPRKMYNELSKKRPRAKGISDVSEIDSINKKINGNLDETFESSDYIRTKPDINNRHQKFNIKNFDTREVNIYDPDTQKAYKLTLSIAELNNGEKIGYAKKILEPNDSLTKAIKKEISTSSASKNGRYSRSDISGTIIPQNNKNVKNSINLPKTDNQGNILSKQQQEYFKDSKIRDDNGNLLTMYHGTEANVGIPDEYKFTIFDVDKQGNNGSWFGNGFYFTENKSHAAEYAHNKGDIYEAYLNIKNPYIPYKDGNYLVSFQEDFKNNFQEANKIEGKLTGEQITRILKDNGYDGVKIGGEAIAFYPEQIKNVDNTAPTINKDIRYSISADGSMQDNKTGKKVILDAETGNTDKTLLAIHNLTEDKLRGILELGGFPAPSIAITNPDINSHEQFGDISVIFNKDAINPANKANEVYDRDVWSPVVPEINYDINNANIKEYITKGLNYDNNDSIINDAVLRYFYDTNLADLVNRAGEKRALETLKDSKTLQYFYKKTIEDSNFKPEMMQTNYSNSNSYGNEELQQFLNEYKGTTPLNELSYDETLELSDTITNIIKEKMYKEAESLPSKKMQESYKKLSDEVVESFKGNYTRLNQFIYSANSMQKNGIDAQTIDQTKTLNTITDKINKENYDKWVDDTFGKLFKEAPKGIRNNKDLFTPSGKRRSFNQLYDEYNLENLVKKLTEGKTKAGQKTFFEGGFGKTSASLATQFDSIEDIKSNQNKLKSSEEIQPTIKEMTDKFNNDLHELVDYRKNNTSSYSNEFAVAMETFEDIQSAVEEFAGKGRLTPTEFRKILDSYYVFDTKKIPDSTINTIIDDLNEMKNIPTDYFEAKPQRAVGLDEIDAIVVPNDLSKEVKEQLKDKGIKIIEYDRNNETEKADILKSLNEYKFSNSSENFDEYLKNRIGKEGTRTKLKELRLPTKQDVVTQKNISNPTESIIKGLKDIYPVDLSNKELETITKDIINNPTEEGILEALKDHRTTYIEDENADTDTINEIKTTIRSTKLDVSKLKNSITDYNDVRKSNFGKLKIGNDGMNIDTFYQYLSNNFPDYFSDTVYNEADQLDAIIDFINEDHTNKTAYEMTDEDIKNSGLIDAITKAINDKNVENVNKAVTKNTENVNTDNIVERNKDLYKQRYTLEKEAQKLDRKIELTDAEKSVVKSLLDGGITENEIPNRYNKDNIIQKYNNDKKLAEVRKEIKQNKTASKQVYNDTAQEVVDNLKKFKDKPKGILYRRETAIRNIQDVVKDKALANKINDTYFKPVLKNEAERTRYINDNVKKIQDLKIDTKTTYPYSNQMVDKNGRQYLENLKINEADVAGLYLENKVGEEYFQKHNIDKKRIDQIANTFKSILDDGVNRMETEVMKAGYAPIGRIDNYFPHFLETRPDGLIGKISNFLGIRTKVQNLPTEIAGKTDTFKPGKTWNQNALHRSGQITDINALKAMENYINGASDVIYHTDDIQKLRALERNIRQSYTDEETLKTIENIRENTELTEEEKEEAIYNKLQNTKTEIPNFVTWLTEYTNILANKKSQSDRSMEYNWGRSTYSTMQDIEGKIASNMIGGNLSVSLTNFAPLAQSMGTTKVGNVLVGMLETTKNTINEALGKGDGFAESSDFLTRRRGTDTIHKQKASEKVSNVLGKPMELIDEFTSEAIVRAKFRENIQNGMTEMEALKNADEYTANLMADRSKGALPTMFNSKNPISKLVNMFQIEPNNMMSNYTKDWRNYGGNKVWAVAKLTVASYAFNAILKSIRGGSDILPDPINIVSQLIKMLTAKDDDDKKKAQDEMISSITGSLPFGSSAVVLANVLGIDVPDSVQNSGRMPVAQAIPNWKNVANGIKSDSSEYKGQQLYKELMKPLLYLGLPTGGAQINKTIEGLKAYEKKGSYKYNSKGEKLLQFPVEQNATNFLKSIAFGKYSTKEGREYATNFDAFNAKQTKLYDETDIEYNDLKTYYKETKGEKDLEKMKYVDTMNITDDDKVKLYKSDILSEKQSKNLDYALNNKLTTKKSFDTTYEKLASKDINLPTRDDLEMMKNANISLSAYSDYKIATKGMTTERSKNEAIQNLNCSSTTKQAIYENTTGKDDTTYAAIKPAISIDNYLDYKSQKFEADKDSNGKSKR